jgi:ferredoxin-NADP reductase
MHREATEFPIYLDGPYGAPAVDVNSPAYKMFLLVSGGIGITPMQSIANDLMQQHRQGRPMKKIHFVWAVKDLDLVSA